MTKKPIKAKAEANDGNTALAEGGETAPLDNVSRLRTHLKADGLALKLLDAWTGAEAQAAKPTLLKVVEDHFRKKK